VLQRIANQWPDSKKMNLSTYIITNDGQPLLQQIEDVISKLKTA
jgi:dephospho-CoA kinase